MGRVTRSAKTNIIAAVAVVLVLGFGAWGFSYQTHQKTNPIKPATTTTKPIPTIYVSYRGVDGKTALELLKTHAKIQTKTSSLGDFVVAINGNDGGAMNQTVRGGGKKYWIYYINHKEAQVGAGAYTTKNGDVIEWKLQ